MRLYLLVMVVGACGFSPSASNEVQPDAHRVLLDADTGSNTGSNTSPAICHVADPGLQLCLDFEDPVLEPSVTDLSMNGHDGTTTDVDHTTRMTQSAASFTSSSDIHIDETADLNIATNLTYETWINLPGAYTDAWPIDNIGEYALHVVGTTVSCYANHAYADAPAALDTSNWHHVACTYGNGMLKTYVDGVRVGCARVTGNIGNPNHAGIELGQNFTGDLDDVHVFSTLLDNVAIAAHADVDPVVEPAQCGLQPPS
jgi:Concanavalin A-like lectin/glucanases superfamily